MFRPWCKWGISSYTNKCKPRDAVFPLTYPSYIYHFFHMLILSRGIFLRVKVKNVNSFRYLICI